MVAPFRTAAIFAKTRTEGHRAALLGALEALFDLIERAGMRTMLDAQTRAALGLEHHPGHSLADISAQADVAIVLGGDGTMLGIARDLAAHDVPLIGINFGRLGFITDIALHQMPEVGLDTPDTAAFVAGELRKLGLEVRTGVGGCGVVALLRGAAPGTRLPVRIGGGRPGGHATIAGPRKGSTASKRLTSTNCPVPPLASRQ